MPSGQEFQQCLLMRINPFRNHNFINEKNQSLTLKKAGFSKLDINVLKSMKMGLLMNCGLTQESQNL